MLQVYLCGNSAEAKQIVADITTRLGLTVLDKGTLSAARELEDFPLRLFPEWRLPLLVTAGLLAFFYIYLLIRDVIYAYVEQGRDISYRILVSLGNKVKIYPPSWLLHCGQYFVFPLNDVCNVSAILSGVSNCFSRHVSSLLPAWSYSCVRSALQRDKVQVRL